MTVAIGATSAHLLHSINASSSPPARSAPVTNANPARLDLNDVLCAMARMADVPILINTDAHSIDGMQVMRYGVMQARRAALTREEVVNTRSWRDFRKLLQH